MTLTIEQLEDVLEMLRLLHGRHDELVGYKIWAAIDGKTYKYIDSDGFMCALQQLINKVDAEHTRLSVGPFTLAEAVASGRPFRRKAWAPLSWARISEHVYNGGALIVFVVGGSAIPVGPNDITACDYELMPEGGE